MDALRRSSVSAIMQGDAFDPSRKHTLQEAKLSLG